MRKKGRKSKIQGCRVQLYRLHTLQGMQQKEGTAAEIQTTLPSSECVLWPGALFT